MVAVQRSPWERAVDAFFALDRARVRYLALCQMGVCQATKAALEVELAELERAAEAASAAAGMREMADAEVPW